VTDVALGQEQGFFRRVLLTANWTNRDVLRIYVILFEYFMWIRQENLLLLADLLASIKIVIDEELQNLTVCRS
jgi:hypothetical protein